MTGLKGPSVWSEGTVHVGWGSGEPSLALRLPDLGHSPFFCREKPVAVFRNSACLGKVEGHREVTAGAGRKQQVSRAGHSRG